MEMDCESTPPRVRFSSFQDYLVRLASWIFAAISFLLFWILGKEFDVSFFFSTLLAFSAVAHLFREISEIGNAYPLWLEIGRHVKSHQIASLPLWISDAIFTGVLFRQGRATLALTAFFFFIVVDWIIASCSRRKEEFFRSLIKESRSESELRSPARVSSEPISDCDLADFLSVKENDELLMRTLRSRNNDSEIIQGEALVEFERESSLAFLNIPFYPAFVGVPRFDFEQISGEGVSVDVSLLQPFGARLEIKRKNQPSTLPGAERESVWIAFYATFPPPKDAYCS